MIDYTNYVIRLTTWLYYKKYISKNVHEYILIRVASYRHECKTKKKK